MLWQWFYPAGLYILSGVIALVGARTIWRNENRNPGAESLALMLILATVWVVGLALGTLSTSLGTKILWLNIHFIGVAYTVSAWLIAINQYVHGVQWFTLRKLVLFGTIPTLAILLVFTNQYHGLMYKEFFIEPYGPYEIISPGYGIALWMFFGYNALLIVWGSIMLITTLGQSWWSFQVNGTIMLVSTLTPVITLILQVFVPDLFGPLKPTSLAIIFFGITAAYGLERARRQKIVSVSRFEIFDTLEDIVFVTDLQNRIVDMNKSAEGLSGESLTDAIGKSISEIFPQLSAVDLGKESVSRLFIERQDVRRVYECNFHHMLNWEGRPVNRIYILRDATKRALMEEQISSSLLEKETLLREIHHRAKNNLQVISSIFSLQSGLIESEQMREVFQESQERIQAIALVHEELYQSEGINFIDFSDYLHTLIDRLKKIKEITNSSISIELQVEDIRIPYDLAIPCGLIAFETISNALKHAFPDKENGTIRIICKKNQANHLFMRISDDGVSIPENIDINDTKTLGFQLITALAQQIQGLINVDRRSGTSIEIVIPTENNP